ncbi:hypothetical protein K438DRAFT_1799695 [Mycena galopus ATCC 62051]|nr:hypothetical protein K438DRAFT_1799695 [Mycena galopus ATCC 62051]
MPPPTTILRLYLALILLCHVSAHPLRREMNAGLDRGLGGLFGDDSDPLVPSDPETEKALPKRPHLPTIATEGIDELLTAEGNIIKTTSSAQTTASSASRSASILTSGTAITQLSTTTSSSSSTSFPSPYPPTITSTATKEAPSASSFGASNEWKVIGITAVSIGLIAGIMLSIVFFDSMWRFLLALVGKRKKGGTEDLIPDWANRDWEVKIASEDGHRYPTLGSLESMTKQQDLTGTSPLISPALDARHSHSLVPTLPPSIYSPSVDPHPLDPLFRRPSASNRCLPRE